MDSQFIQDLPVKNIYRSSPFANQVQTPTNVRSSDRKIVVRAIPGVKARSSSGVLDHRVYSGEAHLHAKLDETSLWYLHMDKGTIPPSLADKRWTRWDDCLTHVKTYFKTRNLEVIEVID